MERYVSKLAVVLLFAMASAVAQEDPAANTDPTFAPVVISDNFRIQVQTNKSVYLYRDVMRLTVKLLNNSPDPVHVGICPLTLTPDDSAGPAEGQITDIDQGYLDGTDVDVAVIPCPPVVIGYATLRRLGPSPVRCAALDAAEEDGQGDADQNGGTTDVRWAPKKFRLPLFGSWMVPGHSTRIISTANILLAGRIRTPVPVPEEPQLNATDAGGADTDNGEPIDVIPAVGKCVPLRPGYYLLNCHIEKLCGVRPAQAQKIIRIKARPIRPVPLPKPAPKPRPIPRPRPKPVEERPSSGAKAVR